MPGNLKRFQQSRQSHFITFSCYERRALLTTVESRQTFELALERVRGSFALLIYGYVVMPEHVHLLLAEPANRMLATALKSLKQGVSRRLLGDAERFWHKRYYDRNVSGDREFEGKLLYTHFNPVRRGLCESPDDWEWSSSRHYATGISGLVEIESEWTANKRDRLAGRLCELVLEPRKPKLS